MANAKAANPMNWKRSFNMDNQDILICDICTEPYDNKTRVPKFLSCHHTVCERCLQIVAGDQANIDCPTCRQVTALGENGVKGLQSNFYLIHIKETMDKIGTPKVKGCCKHSGQPMSFFCEKCAVSICRDCTVIDHKEKEGHSIKDISAAEKEQRDILLEQIKTSKTTHQLLQSKVTQLEAEIQNLTIAKDTALLDIGKSFDKYHSILDKRKEELVKNLNEMYETKKKALLGSTNELTEQTKSLEESIKVTDELTKKGTLLEVVTLKTKLSAMVQSLTEYTATLSTGTNYIQFNDKTAFEALQQSSAKLGSFTASKTLPAKVKLVNATDIPACQPANIKMKVYDFKNVHLKGYDIKAEIIDPEKKVLLAKTTENPEQNEYNVRFIPVMSGRHKFVVHFHGHSFKGSDIVVNVASNNPVSIIGSQGQGKGKFNCPRAVNIDSKQNLYVADTGNKLIQKLNSEGKFQEQFSISGESDNLSTCDLALDEANKVIVCTETILGQNMVPTVGNTVATYQYDGKCKNRFCNKIMKCALCVATNSKGDIIISDYLVHSLFMYDKNGVFMRRISSPSDGFNHPAFICCDKQNNIIVSDTNNDTVQVFNSQGQFKFQFGKSGSKKGQLKQPFGVATNGSEIVVVDSGNKRVQVFSKDGEFKCMIESKDSPFDQPRGVAISNDGCVFVADRNNNCIKKYRYKLD